MVYNIFTKIITTILVDLSNIIIEALSLVGGWMISNLSVEGLIALPALMVGFLVAVAIYNFEDSRKGLAVDAPTVISRVVRVDRVLLSIFLVSILPIAWPSDKMAPIVPILPILMAVYLVGIIFLTQSLSRTFKWARSIESGTRNNFRVLARIEYLETLHDEEKRNAWEKVWQAGEKSHKLIDERELIKLFVTSVQNVRDKYTFAPWLVQDLISTIDTLHTDDPVVMQELVNFCLRDTYRLDGGDNILDLRKSGKLHYAMNLDRLFFAILDRSLKKNDNSFYLLIDSARNFIKSNSLDESRFIKTFAPNFFSILERNYSDNNHWIWETIPDDWKITYEKLEDSKTRKVAFAWFNAYSRWLSGHALFSKKFDINNVLDDSIREMFPTADPILLARLFGFHWAPYGLKEGEDSERAQVRNFVENTLTFGMAGHVHTGFRDKNGKINYGHEAKNEYEEILDIVTKTTIFPAFHDKNKMAKYMKAIRELNGYYTDEKDLNRLKWLDMTLKDIRKRINADNRQKS